MIAPILGVVAIATLLVSAIIYSMIRAKDDADFMAHRRMIGGIAQEWMAAQRQATQSYTVWDEAITRIRARDDAWIADTFGSGAARDVGFEAIYILDEKRRPIYALEGGRLKDPSAYNRHLDRLDPLVREVHDATRVRGETEVLPYSTTSFTLVDGRVKMIVGSVFAPGARRISEQPTHALAFAGIIPLGAPFIRVLAQATGIQDIRLSVAPRLGPDENAVPLKSKDGGVVGWLVWTEPRLAQALIQPMLPWFAAGAAVVALAFVILCLRLVQSLTALAHNQALARHAALHDALTGLPNRAAFSILLDELLGDVAGSRTFRSITLLFIDLDHFKEINDDLGHHAGDMLLSAFAERLRALADRYDMAARLGGDEFVILCLDVDEPGVDALGAKVLEAASTPFDLGDRTATVGVSIGVASAEIDSGAIDLAELVRNADRALYQSKAAGRGRLSRPRGLDKAVA